MPVIPPVKNLYSKAFEVLVPIDHRCRTGRVKERKKEREWAGHVSGELTRVYAKWSMVL